jgi:hypothetical protein
MSNKTLELVQKWFEDIIAHAPRPHLQSLETYIREQWDSLEEALTKADPAAGAKAATLVAKPPKPVTVVVDEANGAKKPSDAQPVGGQG